jgi:cytochrome P450
MERVMDDITQAMDDTVSFDGSTLGKITHWRTLRRLFGLFVPLGVLVRPLIAAARSRKNTESRHSYVDSLIDIRIPNDVDAKRALGDDEILGLVAEFLATNTGVIVACLEWTLANLAIQPEIQKKLRREIDEAVAGEANPWLSEKALRDMPYLRAVVLESLRVHPPSPFVTRGVHDLAAAASGATGRLRKRIIFMVRDIGRHGSAWTDPGKFRPERFLPGGEAESVGPLPRRKETSRMMPFGAGHRFCPGVGLAMLMLKCFLAALVREFHWAAPTDAVIDLTELDGFLKTMKKPLSARLTRRT